MAVSKKKREQVWLKYDKHCAYCGKELTEIKQMQVDHVIPQVAFYGSIPEHVEQRDDIKNLMPACRRCNHYKRSATLEGFRNLMLTLHERIEKPYINKVAIDYGVVVVKPFDGKFYFEKVKSNA